MIRKLILPALAALVLAGCASYQYRSGAGGDYYYGQPTTEYRYYGSPYGSYGYGYPYGWGGSIGYGYGYGYYRNPYYRYYPRYPRPPHSGHGSGHGSNPGHGQRPNQHADRPSWRDLGRLREGAETSAGERRRGPVVRSRPIERRPVEPMQHSAPVRAPIRRSEPAEPRQLRSKRDRGTTPTR